MMLNKYHCTMCNCYIANLHKSINIHLKTQKHINSQNTSYKHFVDSEKARMDGIIEDMRKEYKIKQIVLKELVLPIKKFEPILKKVFGSNDSSLLSGIFPNINKYETAIKNLPLEKKPSIMMYGKELRQPRDVGFFCDIKTVEGYKYSNKLMKSSPLTSELKEILSLVNGICNNKFNAILVNRYNDGNDNIGSHSDSEIGITSTEIVSLSIGSTRKFRIRDKITKAIVFDLPLSHGLLVSMKGNFQKEFLHEIPKELKIKDPRISLTFRYHIN